MPAKSFFLCASQNNAPFQQKPTPRPSRKRQRKSGAPHGKALYHTRGATEHPPALCLFLNFSPPCLPARAHRPKPRPAITFLPTRRACHPKNKKLHAACQL